MDLNILCCPDCRGRFEFTPSRNGNGQHARYGILRCGCFRYPVVDGVPILTKGHVGLLSFSTGETESKGPSVEEVTQLVSEGYGFEALIRCLTFTPRFMRLEQLRGWGVVRALLRQWVERRARMMLKKDQRQLSAEDWFEFFFGALTATRPRRALLTYYRNRFTLPRALAALSLLRLLPSSDRPVLDLACGFGPFGHYLTNRRDPAAVVGVDFNFYLVWGQKNWIAPRGTFVCADASDRLPFVDDAFSALLCSDAFVYFRNRPQVLAELNRCAPGKPIILTRVSNKTASPKDGDALSPEEYMDLLASGGPSAFSEYALVRHYLARRNPLASVPTDVGDLHWDKWLTFVLNGQSLQDTAIHLEDEWPHEVGELAFNPIFEPEIRPNRKQRLSFQFPDIWFAYQNGDMYGYHGDRVECSPDVVLRARGNRADAEVRDLIERFILIGLPERYLKTQL